MQEKLYSGLSQQEIKIINHTIQKLNHNFFHDLCKNPTNPEFHLKATSDQHIRNSVRCLLINQNQELCLLYSRSKNYYAIPGGGIEAEESLLQTLARETLEETGYLIKNPRPIGNIYEERHNRITTTYFFFAQPDKLLHTNYMQDELEEVYILKWLPLIDALQIFKNNSEEQIIEQFPSYKGTFINFRYLKILEFILNQQ